MVLTTRSATIALLLVMLVSIANTNTTLESLATQGENYNSIFTMLPIALQTCKIFFQKHFTI